jgi:hypothetical protein
MISGQNKIGAEDIQFTFHSLNATPNAAVKIDSQSFMSGNRIGMQYLSPYRPCQGEETKNA